VPDFVRLVIYIVFFVVVYTHYGVPFHLLRDLYYSFFTFMNRLNDMIRYRRATANMNERYPEATPEELAATDRVCIICREEMDTGKKLPCGHIFHFNCLRSWLERQQSCPTCRTPVLENPPQRQAQAQPQQPQQQPRAPRYGAAAQRLAAAAAAAQPQRQEPEVPRPRAQEAAPPPAVAFPQTARPPSQQGHQFQAQQQQQPPIFAVGQTLLMPLPTFAQISGITPSLPPISSTPPLDQLSEDQLRAMEGTERRSIEERIKFLQGIQNQIGGIIVQLAQFQQLTAAQDSPTATTAAASASSSTPLSSQFSFGASSRRPQHAKDD